MKGSRDMNTPSEPNAQDTRPQVDEQRRRLTKAGLVAPVVIGTLLSRPVLGAAPHNCTLSGQMSGNVSSHEQGDCSTLGLPPSYYAGLSPTAWPNATNDFLNGQNRPLLFRLTPKSQPTKFTDAFRRKLTNGTNINYEDATVWDVLKGVPVNNNNGNPINNAVLEVKPGMNSTYGLELGLEAVAAYMNAFDQTKYPITREQVVAMFNAVIVTGGIYDPLGLNWDAFLVLTYFRSLHPLA
jgi:hypothetical protein